FLSVQICSRDRFRQPSPSFCRLSAYAAVSVSFFFHDTATTEIYTLSLHDALPISTRRTLFHVLVGCGLLMLKVSRLKLQQATTKIGRAVQQECRDRSRMPSSA